MDILAVGDAQAGLAPNAHASELMPKCWITYLKRNGAEGGKMPITNSLVLGRGAECDVAIHLPDVELKHVQLTVDDTGSVWLDHFGKPDTTTLNGTSVSRRTRVMHEDEMRIRGRIFRFTIQGALALARALWTFATRGGAARAQRARTSVQPLYHARLSRVAPLARAQAPRVSRLRCGARPRRAPRRARHARRCRAGATGSSPKARSVARRCTRWMARRTALRAARPAACTAAGLGVRSVADWLATRWIRARRRRTSASPSRRRRARRRSAIRSPLTARAARRRALSSSSSSSHAALTSLPTAYARHHGSRRPPRRSPS